jgi:hypothetical protein
MNMFFPAIIPMAYGRGRNKGHCIFSIFCGFTANNVHCNAALAQTPLPLYLSGQYGFRVSSMVCAIEGEGEYNWWNI